MEPSTQTVDWILGLVRHFSRGVFLHVLEDEHVQGTLNSFVTRRVSRLVVKRRLSRSAGMAPSRVM